MTTFEVFTDAKDEDEESEDEESEDVDEESEDGDDDDDDPMTIREDESVISVLEDSGVSCVTADDENW
jgi:hypothetical protein